MSQTGVKIKLKFTEWLIFILRSNYVDKGIKFFKRKFNIIIDEW